MMQGFQETSGMLVRVVMLFRKALLALRSQKRCFGLRTYDMMQPTGEDYRTLRKQVENCLVRHDISVWFPRCIDTSNGGFQAGFSRSWQLLPGQSKGLVFQARMTWFTAQVSERLIESSAARFRDYCLHGLKFLQNSLWDSRRGGFFWNLNDDGSLAQNDPDEKYPYGIAFAIYACANVARVTQSEDAVDLGQRAFRWLDQHAHDPSNGGYYEVLDGEGNPLLKPSKKSFQNPLGIPNGYKSSNTHLHLMECFTELYRVWPDPILRDRLTEVFDIVRQKMFVLPGCLNQVFTADFRALPDLDSYGHDIECAYLLIEAAKILEMPDDPGTWGFARCLVNNTLNFAFDRRLGGIFASGRAINNASVLDKVWWAQAEALNAFLLMHERFGFDDLRYWTAFKKTWQFISEYQLDSRNGGWHQTIWADDKPLRAPKGSEWKAAYHTGRALLNVAAGLRRLGKERPERIQL
jgi:cellobiose epimerase